MTLRKLKSYNFFEQLAELINVLESSVHLQTVSLRLHGIALARADLPILAEQQRVLLLEVLHAPLLVQESVTAVKISEYLEVLEGS